VPERLRADALPRLTMADGGAPLAGRTIASVGLRKGGQEFPFEASIASWSSAQGEFVTAIVRDVGVRKQLEETTRQQEMKLVQANKMTALGTLVSGVAHEINNPNQLVLFNSGLLADTWRDACILLDAHQRQEGEFTLAGLPYSEMRDAASTLIGDLKEGALRIDRIVQDLKDFARPQRQGLPQAVEVNEVVERAVRLLAHLVRKRTTRFETQLAPRLPPVRGDAQQIEQVVVNLLVNALEALPDATRGVRVATRANGAGGVVLEVADDGVGIPPEHLERLCDPFFTTKQDSGGTGLGLSVTFSLVQAHGGRLDFESEPGRGTRALVTLPSGPDPG
jgi:signal transduction histidine kinase